MRRRRNARCPPVAPGEDHPCRRLVTDGRIVRVRDIRRIARSAPATIAGLGNDEKLGATLPAAARARQCRHRCPVDSGPHTPHRACGKCQPRRPFSPRSASSPLVTTRTVAPGGTDSQTNCRTRSTSASYAGLVALRVRQPLRPHFASHRSRFAWNSAPYSPVSAEPSDRRLAEVVDEGVLCAGNAEPGAPDAHREVVVFEEANLEALVERPNGVPDVAPHRGTEHRRRADVEDDRHDARAHVARESMRVRHRCGRETSISASLPARLVTAPMQTNPLRRSDASTSRSSHPLTGIVSLFRKTMTSTASERHAAIGCGSEAGVVGRQLDANARVARASSTGIRGVPSADPLSTTITSKSVDVSAARRLSRQSRVKTSPS